jgi:hypothetical protein
MRSPGRTAAAAVLAPMPSKPLVLAALLVILAAVALADDTSLTLLGRAWPDDSHARVSDLGRGVGLVFTPDLSVPGNCRFYESLGFACFQDADWNRVLGDIRTYNIFHPAHVIRTLILETHGTNGNGLKLQTSYDPNADRSYISVGALQERLEPDGIESIIVSACNSGRLLRPSIYKAIDRYNGDRLFLPATRGIFDASADFDPARSHVTIITPAASHIETSLAASMHELAPVTQRLLERAARSRGIAPPQQFAVSDMMMEIILRDTRLALTDGRYVEQVSEAVQPVDASEALFRSFKTYLNSLAAREAPTLASATSPKKSASATASHKKSASSAKRAPRVMTAP